MKIGAKDSSGFSVLELMLVLALLAIAQGWSSLDLNYFLRRNLLRRTAVQLVDVLNHKSLEALSSGEPVVLVFDTVRNDILQIPDSTRSSPRSDQRTFRYSLPEGIRFADVRLPRLESQVPHIRYSADSWSSAGTIILEEIRSGLRCSIIQSKGNSRRIDVHDD